MSEISPVELPARTANGGLALALPGGMRLPVLIERAGPRARRGALEFFTASLRNAMPAARRWAASSPGPRRGD